MKLNTIICAAAVCGCASFATAADEPAKTEATEPAKTETTEPAKAELAEEEKGEEEEDSLVSFEVGLQFDSKYMTYGVVDGKDPILTPSAKVTFFDWAYCGVSSIFDLTKGNGKRGWYGNRAGEYTTIDATVGIAHEFELAEGVALTFDLNYIYEYVRRYYSDMNDTQYINLELGLTGFWVEPTLWIERDIMADDGTYVNLSLAHTFPLIGDEEDPTLTFTPSIGQGWGNTRRTRGYGLAEDHGGLMDSTVKGEFEYKLCDYVSLTAYVAYSDYWFDRKLRHGAREYNGSWSDNSDKYANSWNFYGGVGVTLSF